MQFTIQELAFLMESAKAMTIKGVDAPFVTGVLSKIQTAAKQLEEKESTPNPPSSKSK